MSSSGEARLNGHEHVSASGLDAEGLDPISRMRRWLPVALLVGISSSLGASGCWRMTRAKECEAFISMVNAALREIDERSPPQGDRTPAKPSDMRALADRYQKLAKDVSAAEITTPELKGLASEYRGMAERAAATARRIADAIEKSDLEQAKAASDDFDRVSNQEKDLVTRINGFCKGPSKEPADSADGGK